MNLTENDWQQFIKVNASGADEKDLICTADGWKYDDQDVPILSEQGLRFILENWSDPEDEETSNCDCLEAIIAYLCTDNDLAAAESLRKKLMHKSNK